MLLLLLHLHRLDMYADQLLYVCINVCCVMLCLVCVCLSVWMSVVYPFQELSYIIIILLAGDCWRVHPFVLAVWRWTTVQAGKTRKWPYVSKHAQHTQNIIYVSENGIGHKHSIFLCYLNKRIIQHIEPSLTAFHHRRNHRHHSHHIIYKYIHFYISYMRINQLNMYNNIR